MATIPLPTLFIGSSTEALPIARAVKARLDGVAEVMLWTDGDRFKKVGEFFLDSLVAAVGRFDFAVLIFGLDDVIKIRNRTQRTTRDNVLFELGLFWSQLGRKRTFVLAPVSSRNSYRILSDLEGLTLAEYSRGSRNIEERIADACGKIEERVRHLRHRAATSAPRTVFDVGRPLAELMRAARRKGLPIVVKNIGLDMESTWPLVREQILELESIESVTWQSLMVDADSPQLQGMWSDTVSQEVAHTSEDRIRAFCGRRQAELARRNIHFSCRAYASPPTVHGFLFNDSTAFISLCGIRDGKLDGSPNPYVQVQKPDGGPVDEAALHLIRAFESWFDHHWTRGARTIWDAGEGKENR